MQRHVFVDTSEFVAANFAFDGPRLRALMLRIEQNQVVLVMPTIAVEEVRSKIKSAMKTARSSVEAAKNSARILRELPNELSFALFGEIDFDSLTAQLLSHFDIFTAQSRAQIVGADYADSAAVFDLYFRSKAPFESAKKKHEFPDAFNLSCVSEWAQSESCHVLVASSDVDVKDGIESFANLEHVGSLQTLLDRIAHEFDVLASHAVRALTLQMPSLRADLIQRLDGVKPHMTGWPGNASILGLRGIEFEPALLKVEAQSDGWACAEFDANASADFEVLFKYQALDDLHVSEEGKFCFSDPTRKVAQIRSHIWQLGFSLRFDPANPTDSVTYEADWRIPSEINFPFDGADTVDRDGRLHS